MNVTLADNLVRTVPTGSTLPRKTLNLADYMFLALESPEVTGHVAFLALFTPPVDAGGDFVTNLVAGLREERGFAAPFNYVLKRPRFSLGLPSWDQLPDEQVELDYHLRHSALPQPGGQRELGMLISRLHSRPLDPTRPMWEVHVIEGLEGGRFAMYLKVHHALMDGVTTANHLGYMLSADPATGTASPIWAAADVAPDPPTPATIDVLGRATEIARLARGLGQVAVDVLSSPGTLSDPVRAFPYRSPASRSLNGRISRQRRVATQSYDFQRLRAVAKTAGVPVNVVFLAITSGALRQYLAETGEPTGSTLTADVPRSLRESPDDPRSNAVAIMTVKLFTEIDDPIERIRAIARSEVAAKDALLRLPADVLAHQGLMAHGPLAVHTLLGLAGRGVAPLANVVVSNVPGPLEPRYYAGASLDEAYPVSGLAHGWGLNITSVTAAGKFNVGIVGCHDLVPHLQRIAVAMGESLGELETALALT